MGASRSICFDWALWTTAYEKSGFPRDAASKTVAPASIRFVRARSVKPNPGPPATGLARYTPPRRQGHGALPSMTLQFARPGLRGDSPVTISATAKLPRSPLVPTCLQAVLWRVESSINRPEMLRPAHYKCCHYKCTIGHTASRREDSAPGPPACADGTLDNCATGSRHEGTGGGRKRLIVGHACTAKRFSAVAEWAIMGRRARIWRSSPRTTRRDRAR